MLETPVPREHVASIEAQRLRPDVFLCTLLALMLIGGALALALPPAPAPPAELVASFFSPTPKKFCKPEPKEHTIFVIVSLAAPLVALAAGRVRARRPSPRLALHVCRLLAVGGCAIVARAIWPKLSTIVEGQDTSLLFGLALLGLGVAHCVLRGLAAKLHGLAAALLATVALVTVIAHKLHSLERFTDWGPDEVHLEAFLFSVAQAAGGKHCLVDYVAQYGCYGELLAPALHALGSTIGALSWLMIALQLVGVVAIALFLRRSVRNRWLVLATLVVVVAAWMMSPVRVPIDVHDHYYQYLPVRFVFPALSLALGAAWWRPSALRAAGLGAFAALALFWNLESGLAAAGSLLAVVGLDLLPRENRPALTRTLLHVAAFTLGLAAGAASLAFVLRASAGTWPDASALFRYADLFFVTGWHMEPIPLEPSPWMVIVGLYVALIVRGVTGGARDASARSAMQLGVLGVGLFTYYVGRSLDPALFAVSWPAMLAVALLADGVLRAPVTRTGRFVRAAFAGVLAMTLGLSAALAQQRLSWPITRGIQAMPHFQYHVDLIEQTSKPSTPIAVLAMHQGALLLHARRAQAPTATGMMESLLVSDVEELAAQLAEGRAEVLYVDRDLDFARIPLLEILKPTLERHFTRFAQSRDRRLEAFRHHRAQGRADHSAR